MKEENNLLNSGLYTKDNFIPNILRYLGVNEEIVKNPEAIKKIYPYIEAIAMQNNLEIPNISENFTEEQIKLITNALKLDKIIPEEKRQDIINTRTFGTKQLTYYGLDVDKETGNITLCQFAFAGSLIDGKNSYIETKFSLNEDKNLILSEYIYDITETNYEILRTESKSIIDPDGNYINIDTKEYDENNNLIKHSISDNNTEPELEL